MVTRLKIPVTSLSQPQPLCSCCVLAKQGKMAYQRSASKTDRPLELVHVDLMGPMEHESLGVYLYLLAIEDDFSRFGKVVPLENKGEVPGALIKTLEEWAVLRETPVKRVRSDNGTKFVNNALETYFAQKGTVHETSAPYTPQQNGVVERYNRTIKEKVRCSLQECRASQDLWAEAELHASYLKNVLPAAGRTATPWELFIGRVLDLSQL
jgi:transposase InsO family protein